MSHHLIEAENLSYTYPDGTPALDGISFRITHGESVAIVGANGAGKSTLLLHLSGCLLASGGQLRIGDFMVTSRTLDEVRRSVGMVFQDPDDQLFMPTVFDDVAFAPRNLGLTETEVAERVESALSLVNMVHLRERPPYKLSAGEKRAVAIATILSIRPDILVMDEPAANLDPRNRRALINLLRTFDHTKIIATHDLDMALDVCARTIIIHKGSIAADGATSEVLSNAELLKKCSLERPLSMQ
jgi:cobalt/nickel transport system ATP-binding protein